MTVCIYLSQIKTHNLLTLNIVKNALSNSVSIMKKLKRNKKKKRKIIIFKKVSQSSNKITPN